MDLAEFRHSVDAGREPDGLGRALRALWTAARGDWDGAHAIAQDGPGADCSWVHAYLHRVEGDLSNAGYWYRRAGRAAATGGLDEEWEEIVRELLAE